MNLPRHNYKVTTYIFIIIVEAVSLFIADVNHIDGLETDKKAMTRKTTKKLKELINFVQFLYYNKESEERRDRPNSHLQIVFTNKKNLKIAARVTYIYIYCIYRIYMFKTYI